MSQSQMEANQLVLDGYTVKDLEIFESEADGASLFQFCNLSRTEGGAKTLRRRMAHPWSNADRIKSTQDSLSFILTQRDAFTTLPSAYTASRVERYTREPLPIVIQNNVIEFSLGAFSLWADHDRHYSDIARGVHVTCGMMQVLRSFVKQTKLASLSGELVALIDEMRSLLNTRRLASIPDQGVGRRVWKVLRADQVFRMHEKEAVSRLLQLVYEIDALVAMADVTQKHGFILPEINMGALRVRAEGLVHPFVENAVANPVELDERRRVLFLTGPNMAGKTTYLRAVATALYLAHLGMGVPASRFSFVPAQRLFSSFSLSDDLRGGVSYFRAEALRIKAIAQAVAEGHKVIALMDEPFKGTNVKDALDASLAILKRFAVKKDCLFMLSSHLIELVDRLATTAQIDYRYFDARVDGERLCFDFLLHSGVSDQRLGMRVLQEEGIFELLDECSCE